MVSNTFPIAKTNTQLDITLNFEKKSFKIIPFIYLMPFGHLIKTLILFILIIYYFV